MKLQIKKLKPRQHKILLHIDEKPTDCVFYLRTLTKTKAEKLDTALKKAYKFAKAHNLEFREI